MTIDSNLCCRQRSDEPSPSATSREEPTLDHGQVSVTVSDILQTSVFLKLFLDTQLVLKEIITVKIFFSKIFHED